MEHVVEEEHTESQGVIPESNWTPFPNVVIDGYMRELSGSSFKALAAIVRSTIGWHKTRDRIAQSQIMAIAGLSRNAVKAALKELLEKSLIIEAEKPGNRDATLYDLNIEYQKMTPNQEDDSTVEYQKMTPQRVKNCPSRGSKIDPTKEKKYNKEREEATASAISETRPGNSDNGQRKEGRRCTDPVIQAYVQEHVDEYGFEPQIPFGKVGKLLKELRRMYTDEQLIKIVKVARESRAWFRRGNSFDLATVLSSSAVNQIRRDRPDIFEEPKPPELCPACGSPVGKSRNCFECHLTSDRWDDPEAVAWVKKEYEKSHAAAS